MLYLFVLYSLVENLNSSFLFSFYPFNFATIFIRQAPTNCQCSHSQINFEQYKLYFVHLLVISVLWTNTMAGLWLIWLILCHGYVSAHQEYLISFVVCIWKAFSWNLHHKKRPTRIIRSQGSWTEAIRHRFNNLRKATNVVKFPNARVLSNLEVSKST